MHLWHGVQKKGPPQPLTLWAGSWAMCLCFVLLCSPMWARSEESRRGLPSSCFRIPTLCKLPRQYLLGMAPGQGSPGVTRVAAQLME